MNENNTNENKLFCEDEIGFVELIDVFGNDLTVVNAARVSFNKESELIPIQDPEGSGVIGYEVSDRDQKLINYLAKHKHVTPFFHPQLQFRIKMPIYVAREWYRHVIGFARNEVSRRYITEEPESFVPQILRARDKNVKQGSTKDPVEKNEALVEEMKAYCESARAYYNRLLEQGVCPEQARGILPQSMYTEFIETASLSAYARLVKLRVEATAQKEIQVFGEKISELAATKFPVSWEALIKY